MPFRRTRRRRRSTRRRRPTALKAVKRLARFVDTELHQDTLIADVVGVQSAGVFIQMQQIAVGDTDVHRNGLQVSLRSIQLKFIAERGNTDACMRIILFIDKQVNGAFPLFSQLLEVTVTPTLQITSPFNNDFRRRFTILSDTYKTFVDGNSDKRCWKLNRKLSHKIRYTGDTGAIADVTSGMVYLALLTDQLGGAAAVTTSLVSRTWFAP